MRHATYCLLSLSGDDTSIEELFASVFSFTSQGIFTPLDFNRVIQIPEDLNIPYVYIANLLYQHTYLEKKLTHKQYIRIGYCTNQETLESELLAKRYHDNMKRYGMRFRKEWTVKNWGCTTNACVDSFQPNNPTQLQFKVYGGIPISIFKTLSSHYRGISFQLNYTVEGSWIENMLTFYRGSIHQS